MFPEITVHRPQGVVPKLAVRKRTIVEYQPSWLLLVVPALAVLGVRRKKSHGQTKPSQSSRADVPDPATASKPRRRRPVQVGLVTVARLRRRPGGPAAPDDVIVVSPVTP